MISTTVMQIIAERKKDMVGFSISQTGMARRLLYWARRENRMLTIDDVLDTLRYMLSRGWLQPSGQWGSQQLYSLAGYNQLKLTQKGS